MTRDEELSPRVADGIAYVPQGRMIFPTLTVEGEHQTGLENAGASASPTTSTRSSGALRDASPQGRQLSAASSSSSPSRGLVTDPKVLLLDEPTEGIQPSIIKDRQGAERIRKLREITIVVSEQVLSFALDMADRLFVIEKARSSTHETSRADTDEAKIKSYLGVGTPPSRPSNRGRSRHA